MWWHGCAPPRATSPALPRARQRLSRLSLRALRLLCRRLGFCASAPAATDAILKGHPGIDGGQKPRRAIEQGNERWRAKIKGRSAALVAQNLPRRLLARPARPYHARSAVAGGIAC